MATKKPKKRAERYNEKLKVNGSFSELMNELFPKSKAIGKDLTTKKATKRNKKASNK